MADQTFGRLPCRHAQLQSLHHRLRTLIEENASRTCMGVMLVKDGISGHQGICVSATPMTTRGSTRLRAQKIRRNFRQPEIWRRRQNGPCCGTRGLRFLRRTAGRRDQEAQTKKQPNRKTATVPEVACQVDHDEKRLRWMSRYLLHPELAATTPGPNSSSAKAVHRSGAPRHSNEILATCADQVQANRFVAISPLYNSYTTNLKKRIAQIWKRWFSRGWISHSA